jgi:hypothetical protein
MAVVVPAVLLLSTFAGLAAGRWQILPAVAALIPAALLLLSPEAGALTALGLAGVALGVQLHRVVAESTLPRPS